MISISLMILIITFMQWYFIKMGRRSIIIPSGIAIIILAMISNAIFMCGMSSIPNMLLIAVQGSLVGRELYNEK